MGLLMMQFDSWGGEESGSSVILAEEEKWKWSFNWRAD